MSDQLFDRIKDTETSELADKLEEVEQLEPEEHERRSRAASFSVEKHWKKNIRPLINWVVFGVIIILVCSILIILASYLWDIRTDTAAKSYLLGKVFEIIVISGATLYVEGRINKK